MTNEDTAKNALAVRNQHALPGQKNILSDHIAEAIGFRSLDWELWT